MPLNDYFTDAESASVDHGRAFLYNENPAIVAGFKGG